MLDKLKNRYDVSVAEVEKEAENTYFI
ncbi:MAG TPA: DUF503 domain-containing protein [Thermoanaerobacterales bacterium]|nr:DUF503 domain-containing protein [Thermoanaerobacterales bacterium]